MIKTKRSTGRRFPSTLLKKYSVRIGVLSIAFSTMFLVVSPATKAGSQDGAKDDLVSELHLQTASLPGTKINSAEVKDLKDNSLQAFSIPLKEGLSVFIDSTPPPHQDGLRPRDIRTNYRAVIGFHFSLR